MQTKKSRFSRAFRIGVALTTGLVGAGFGAAGCLTRPLCVPDCTPHTTNLYVSVYRNESIDKIDLLFAVDNSSSMADKQATLRDAVPDLVNRLVNPICVDPSGQTSQPNSALDNCPAGFEREFQPIRDIHIGVVSSSLGGHGVACPVNTGDDPDDQGHLLGTLPRFTGGAAPHMDALGFLNWNPDANPNQDSVAFSSVFQNMIVATGQRGCGFEAQLESFYHFLIDPNPYQTVTTGTCPGNVGTCSFPSGVDQTILAQRGAFLRPDSLLAVVVLSDENDCSIVDDGQGFFVVQNSAGTMFKGSQMCDTNPNDPCCYPCGATSGAPAGGTNGCPDTCAGRGNTVTSDPRGLRCHNMKQRFGIDFLYPTTRYVNALTLHQICTSVRDLNPNGPSGCPDANGDGQPDVFENPIFRAPSRANDLVFFAGIIGVPWQDIADQTRSDATNLVYQQVADISWPTILGDPGTGTTNVPVLPSDQRMIESRLPRSGIPGPGSTLNADPIVGHEFSNTDGNLSNGIGDGRDLQKACIFRLATPNTCIAGDASCDCDPDTRLQYAPGNEFDSNPLCQADNGTYTSTQVYAKAYPGLRELEVLKGFGANSIVASICARNLTASGQPDYGYRPAVRAIVERLSEKLGPSCLPRPLAIDPTSGDVPCSIIEAIEGSATCDPNNGRTDVTNSQVISTARARLKAEGVCDVTGMTSCSSFSFCTISEAAPSCQTDVGVAPGTVPGWCYIDVAAGGNRDAAGGCDRAIRFVDPNNATPVPGARALIACFGAAVGSTTVTPIPGDGGP